MSTSNCLPCELSGWFWLLKYLNAFVVSFLSILFFRLNIPVKVWRKGWLVCGSIVEHSLSKSEPFRVDQIAELTVAQHLGSFKGRSCISRYVYSQGLVYTHVFSFAVSQDDLEATHSNSKNTWVFNYYPLVKGPGVEKKWWKDWARTFIKWA